MYFRVPLQSPLQRCPPIRQVKYGPSPPTRQRGLRCEITFSILHYRSRPLGLHSKVWNGASAAGAAHQDLHSPLSTVTSRYLCISKFREGDTCCQPLLSVTLALDYRIRWDYISIRTGASGPIGERRIQS